MSTPQTTSESLAHPRRPAWVRFLIRVTGITGPAIAVGVAAQVVRLPPLAGAIDGLGAQLGGWLPHGVMVHVPNGMHAVCGPLDAPWGGLYYWHAQPPWWIAYAIGIAVARVVLVAAARFAVGGETTLSRQVLGSKVDVCATLGWFVAAALLWQFFWGMRHGMQALGVVPVPVLLGPGSCGLVWLGAAAGYFHSVRSAIARWESRDADGVGRCARCGYPIGVAPKCVECGQEHGKPVKFTLWQRLARAATAYGPLTVAAVLMMWPYLAPLIARALPIDWVLFIAGHMPLWW